MNKGGKGSEDDYSSMDISSQRPSSSRRQEDGSMNSQASQPPSSSRRQEDGSMISQEEALVLGVEIDHHSKKTENFFSAKKG